MRTIFYSGMMIFFLANAALAQDVDSLTTDESIGTAWANKPPNGKSEKTQGGIIAGLGLSSILSGIILLNKKDPCEDITSPNVFCTSNVDQVHALGAVSAAIGVGAVVFGIVRFSQGVKKARVYEEWKRKHSSLTPQLKYSGFRGFELGLLINF